MMHRSIDIFASRSLQRKKNLKHFFTTLMLHDDHRKGCLKYYEISCDSIVPIFLPLLDTNFLEYKTKFLFYKKNNKLAKSLVYFYPG